MQDTKNGNNTTYNNTQCLNFDSQKDKGDKDVDCWIIDKIIDDNSDDINDQKLYSSVLQDEGYKYFGAARKLIDVTSERVLSYMQKIILLFIFLQCLAGLPPFYSYIGVAMGSALNDGLHRVTDPNKTTLNPI